MRRAVISTRPSPKRCQTPVRVKFIKRRRRDSPLHQISNNLPGIRHFADNDYALDKTHRQQCPGVDVGSDPEYTEDTCGQRGLQLRGLGVTHRSDPDSRAQANLITSSGDTGLPRETREQGGRVCQRIRLRNVV